MGKLTILQCDDVGPVRGAGAVCGRCQHSEGVLGEWREISLYERRRRRELAQQTSTPDNS